MKLLPHLQQQNGYFGTVTHCVSYWDHTNGTILQVWIGNFVFYTCVPLPVCFLCLLQSAAGPLSAYDSVSFRLNCRPKNSELAEVCELRSELDPEQSFGQQSLDMNQAS